MTSGQDVLFVLEEALRNLERRITALELREPDAGFGVWNDWTPTSIVQGVTNITFTRLAARFTRIGKTVFVLGSFTLTSAGVAGGAIIVTMPAAVPRNKWDVNSMSYNGQGTGLYYDPGTTWYRLFPYFVVGHSVIQFWAAPSTDVGVLGVAPNFAVANGDVLEFSCFYETDQ